MFGISRSSSRSSEVHLLPAAGFSPLTSMSVQTHSSLNSALRNVSSVAESLQSEGEEAEGGGASEFQGVEEEEHPSHVNENVWKRGEDGKSVNGSKGQHIDGGIGLGAQLSTMGSIPMEDVCEGDEAASSSDFEPFEASELQLIEDALRSLLSVEEGKIEASKAVEHNFSSSNDLQDLHDVARLLKKVQAVKARNKGTPLKRVSSSPDMSLGQGPPGGEDLEPADIRQVVQAAAQTALAAAKTAETVVSSLNRNSQAMEELCKALTNSKSLQAPREEIAEQEEDDDEDEDEKMLAIERQQTEIAKSLIRQNRMTHWVLGFIVVSSLVWRYGVVKFVKRVNNTIQNPFQGITDMFKPKEDHGKDNNGLQLKLPTILSGEEEAAEGKRRAEKEKENQKFDLGKMFSGHEPKENQSRKFNLGSIASNLPGHGPDSI